MLNRFKRELLVEWGLINTSLVALEASPASLAVSDIPEAQNRKGSIEGSFDIIIDNVEVLRANCW